LARAGPDGDAVGASLPYVGRPRLGVVLERVRPRNVVGGRAVRRRGPTWRDGERVGGVGGHRARLARAGPGGDAVGASLPYVGRPRLGVVLERVRPRNVVGGRAVRRRGPTWRDGERVGGVGGHRARLARAGSGGDADGGSLPFVDRPRLGVVLERGASLRPGGGAVVAGGDATGSACLVGGGAGVSARRADLERRRDPCFVDRQHDRPTQGGVGAVHGADEYEGVGTNWAGLVVVVARGQRQRGQRDNAAGEPHAATRRLVPTKQFHERSC